MFGNEGGEVGFEGVGLFPGGEGGVVGVVVVVVEGEGELMEFLSHPWSCISQPGLMFEGVEFFSVGKVVGEFLENVDGLWWGFRWDWDGGEKRNLIANLELVGFDAFEGVGEGVPDEGVVVGSHGNGTPGVGGNLEPVVAGAFDPVFDGLVEGLVRGRVEADGAPMGVGVVNGEGAKIIDDL